MKKYITTKENCQKSIDDKGGVVCSQCGGKITPIETVDNSRNPTFWQGCESCEIFDSGTSIEIFNTAVDMVDNHNFRAYSYDRKPTDEASFEFDYWRKSQIKGATRIIADVLRIYHNQKEAQ